MSDDHSLPRCVRCGYVLVGNPPPARCPECGHVPRRHERWLDGELHREGPGIVLPVLIRQAGACAALLTPIALGVLLNRETLRTLEIPLSVDERWCQAAAGVGALVATILWTWPMPTRDAHQFGLDRSRAWRAWLPLLQAPWLVYSALLMVAAMLPVTVPGPLGAPSVPSREEVLMRWAAIMGVIAQVPWILSMRHLACVAEYLRDGLVRKSVVTWTWIWVAGLVVIAVRVPFMTRYGGGSSLDAMLEMMLALSRVGLVWAGVNAILVLWVLVNALTMAHEEVARDERRSEREASRYRVPK